MHPRQIIPKRFWKSKNWFLLVLLWCSLGQAALGQYTLFGNAFNSGGTCHQLTAASNNQLGAVYNNTTISLNQAFDLRFTVYLGNNNGGADGICFVMRSATNPGTGTNGGSLGVGGLTNMLGVEFDTWQNNPLGDPFFDHIAVISNGSTSHILPSHLAGPIQASPTSTNIEDGQNHQVRISWDPGTTTLSIYFDCSLRLSYTGNIVANLFGGNPNVFWGFAGSTGGANNQQSFCQVPYPVSFSNSFSDTTICPGASVPLNVGQNNLATYSWSNAGSLSNASIANPVATPTGTTNYIATVTYACTSVSDTVTVNVHNTVKPNLGNDTSFCNGNNLTLTAPHPSYQSYAWSGGSTNPSLSVSATATVNLTVTDTNNCTAGDTIAISVFDIPAPNLGADTTICPGDSLVLDVSFQAATYAWNTGSTNPVQVANQAGTYGVVVDNFGCIGSDSINLSLYPASSVDLGVDTVLCNTAPLVLSASVFGGTYAWQNGSNLPNFTVGGPGTYWVNATNICGVFSDSILVDYQFTPVVNLPPDDTICDGVVVNIDATFPGATYLWSTGAVSPTFPAQQTGSYWVQVSNLCGMALDTFELTTEPPLNFDLGFDRLGCEGDTFTIVPNTTFPPTAALQWSHTPVANQMAAFLSGTYWLHATNVCGTFRDTAEVDIRPQPQVSISGDTEACLGSAIELFSTGQHVITYAWSTNETTQDIRVRTPGQYVLAASNACGLVRDTITVDFRPLPEVSLGLDTSFCRDLGPITLQLPSIANLTYTWSTGDVGSDLIIDNSGFYTVTATDDLGCKGNDNIVIEEECPVTLWLPNAFSPNEDGDNDLFQPKGDGILEYRIEIYNRWGELVWFSEDLNEGWNGKFKGIEAPIGVYAFIVDYRGRLTADRQVAGHLTLVR